MGLAAMPLPAASKAWYTLPAIANSVRFSISTRAKTFIALSAMLLAFRI